MLPSTNDLRSAKAAFVKAYMDKLTRKESELIAACDPETSVETNSTKYKEGVAAWMESNLRSVLTAGKAKGFANVRTS